MLKVALGGLHKDPRGGKEGRKGVKIGGIGRKGSLALKKGHFKRTGQCPALWGITVLTKGMKGLSGGMRN